MDERKTRPEPRERYVPPEILATYSKKQLDQMITRSGMHGSGYACSCGCSGIQEPWIGQEENPLP